MDIYRDAWTGCIDFRSCPFLTRHSVYVFGSFLRFIFSFEVPILPGYCYFIDRPRHFQFAWIRLFLFLSPSLSLSFCSPQSLLQSIFFSTSLAFPCLFLNTPPKQICFVFKIEELKYRQKEKKKEKSHKRN